MKTLAQSWAERLAELRAICAANGERLHAGLKFGYAREHAGAWWAQFCDAAERGDELSPAVWRSAEQLAKVRRMEGWVARLRTRNAAARRG